MSSPPFRLAEPNALERAGLTQARHPHSHDDACCSPSANRQQTRPAPQPARRRARLADLDPHLHCSIIGTCLTTHELRKLMPKFADLNRERASDLEIHHTAVERAIEGGACSKALHKVLDERYSGAIRRFDKAADEDALLALWDDALQSGDIPPAYWALMTHPLATLPVRQKAFGDLHMLSHLVGAANRADIRRLVALEADNADLREKIDRQQARLAELASERDAARSALADQVARAVADAARRVPAADDTAAELERLRALVDDTQRRIALHTSRREAAEQRAQQERDAALEFEQSRDRALALARALQAECDALEHTLGDTTRQTGTTDVASKTLDGKRIVYVGGRPGSNAALKSLVANAGGELTVHDGGIEDRKGLLAAALPGADFVVFPVDCIDHDSMQTVKRICERAQIAWHPLRTASVASFVEWLGRLNAAEGATRPASTPPNSAFCLRHG